MPCCSVGWWGVSWYNPDSDTCWWRLPLYWLAKRYERPQSCFEQSVSRLSTMMWQGLLCGICMHPCALPGCELRFVMVTPLALYWLPGDQTRTISNAEVVLSHSWRLSRCPACVLCSLRYCTIHYRTVDRICVFHHTRGLCHVVSRGCARGRANG
jgi:hypothetical protein